MEFNKYRIDEITINLDNLRKPLNNEQRKQISNKKLYPYYGANNIMDYVDEYIFDEEIICIAEDGGSWGFGEKCSYIVNEKCWVNNHAHVLKAKDNNLSLKYLNYYLNYHDLNSKITGTTRGKLTKSALNSIEIMLPNREMQDKIVNILDKAQELIDKRKEQIEQLDELVKSRFIEMFGDPVKNPKGWEKKKLSDECNIITGNTPSRKIDEYYGDYIEWIKSDNITNAETYLTTAKEYLSEKGLNVGRSVEANSILMTCIAGSLKCIGNVAIADRKVAFNQQINGIETLENNVYFMFEQFNLSQQYIQSTINMALKGILSKSQLSELEFIFPPLELQNEFAKFFVEMHKVRLNMENSLKELEDNFNSLIQKAFKGELLI